MSALLNSNQRELELVRHVSLRQLDPLALLSLIITGTCTATVPEWLYDRDRPGLYMRRIKSVALSIPSVVGPYTSSATVWNRRVSPVAQRPREGPLTEPTAGARAWPRERVLVPHTCRSRYPSGPAQLGGNATFRICPAGDAIPRKRLSVIAGG